MTLVRHPVQCLQTFVAGQAPNLTEITFNMPWKWKPSTSSPTVRKVVGYSIQGGSLAGTDLDRPVEAAGDDPLHVPGAAVQGEAGHRVIVAAQHRGAVARVQLPHTDGLVAATAET